MHRRTNAKLRTWIPKLQIFCFESRICRKMLRRTSVKPVFLIVFTLCSCTFFWAVVHQQATPRPLFILDYQLIESPDFKRPFTISTEGCIIPAMAPVDDSIKEFLAFPNPEKCDKPSDNLLSHNTTHIWTKKDKASQYKDIRCCYRAFERTQNTTVGPGSVDDRVHYHTCKNFPDHITVEDEFVRVTCFATIFYFSREIHDQFFLFARKRNFVVHNDVEELKNDNSSYNILLLGIDSVSRLNLYRTMPKTIRYLKNNGAIELTGYNKVGENSYPNLMPMFLGVSADEMAKTCLPDKNTTYDNCPFVWKKFKQAGYYTAFVEDTSLWGTFNYLATGFAGTPTDYYLDTFINQIEKLMRNKRNKHLCSNDEYLYQMLLDYIDGLTTALDSSRLFAYFWETILSHDKLNDAAIMDDSYVELFRKLDSKKYLEQTILIFVSDHGMRFGKITHTKRGRLESRLPFLFILAPPSFRSKYSEAFNNLRINSYHLTTPYNLYATFNDLTNLHNINNDKILLRSKQEYWKNRSISLFLPIPGNRTCKLAGISDNFCTCLKEIPISIDSDLVKDGSEYLIKYMNQLLAAHEHCAELSIEKLLDAREVIGGKADQHEVGWREVLVVVQTRPGQGEFEATLRHQDGGQWSLGGQVGRLNLYGNQSHCVDDKLLKLYCYCTTSHLQ